MTINKKASETESTDLSGSGVNSTFLKNINGLKRYLAKFLPSADDVEDVLQDTYLRALQAEKESQVHYPKAFLYKVARNLALNFRSKAVNRLTDSLEDSDYLTVLVNNISMEERLDKSRQFGEFCRAVTLLPPQCRQVFVLKKVYMLSNKAIAEKMDISVSTVDKHLAKALRMCRNHLASFGYDVMAENVGDKNVSGSKLCR